MDMQVLLFNFYVIILKNVLKVAGWGNTKGTTNKDDDGLKVLTVPYVAHDECTEVVPTGFIRYITPDKFCAGFKNGDFVYQMIMLSIFLIFLRVQCL